MVTDDLERSINASRGCGKVTRCVRRVSQYVHGYSVRRTSTFRRGVNSSLSITHYCSLCINSFIHYSCLRICMYVSVCAYFGHSSLIADFGGIGSSGISFSRFSAPLALGLDEMLQICRCALSGDELVFKPDLNDEMRCCMLLCKPIARSHH